MDKSVSHTECQDSLGYKVTVGYIFEEVHEIIAPFMGYVTRKKMKFMRKERRMTMAMPDGVIGIPMMWPMRKMRPISRFPMTTPRFTDLKSMVFVSPGD